MEIQKLAQLKNQRMNTFDSGKTGSANTGSFHIIIMQCWYCPQAQRYLITHSTKKEHTQLVFLECMAFQAQLHLSMLLGIKETVHALLNAREMEFFSDTTCLVLVTLSELWKGGKFRSAYCMVDKTPQIGQAYICQHISYSYSFSSFQLGRCFIAPAAFILQQCTVNGFRH